MTELEDQLRQRLAFVQSAEALKRTERSAYAVNGKTETTAEHSWRLCLLALALEDLLPAMDFSRLLKICIIHDLGEAINGDIPATMQCDTDNKAANERADLLTLMQALDNPSRERLLSLYDEYTAVETLEAKTAKALDKIETLIQHNQGLNPAGFDYAFNLEYGRQYTDQLALLKTLRHLIDQDTLERLEQSQNQGSGSGPATGNNNDAHHEPS